MRLQSENDAQDIAQAKLDRQIYNTALLYGDNLRLTTDIEGEYGLLGYPPELVSVGLNATCEGKDPEKAVETYIVERMLRVSKANEEPSGAVLQPDTHSLEKLVKLLAL
jgi:hypothetical protein